MRRLLVVMPAGQRQGGAELLLLQLAERTAQRGVHLHVVFLEDGPLVEEIDATGVVSSVIETTRIRDVPRLVSTANALRVEIAASRPDVVVSWMTKAAAYVGAPALLARRPHISLQHGAASPGALIDRIAQLVSGSGILCVSESTASVQARMRPSRSLRVVPPGVDLARFSSARLGPADQVRRALELPASGPIVTMVGRLQHWKGMHVLIEAMLFVRAACPDALCVIVGGEHGSEPAYRAELEQLVARGGLERHVRLVGAQPDPERWMQAADVVVHASFGEPFGIVVLEAMALGKAVVAADGGGPREIISDGVDGRLSPEGDAPALGAAITGLLTDAETRRTMGAHARERAAAFSLEAYVDRFLAAVEDLVSSS